MKSLKNREKKAEDLRRDFDTYKIKKYAILIDETSNPEYVPELPDLELVGYYTFSLSLADSLFNGSELKLLPDETVSPNCDAWLLATNSKVCYALTSYLFKNEREHQVILRLIDEDIVSIYSYVDFFKGETESRLYLTNIFERTYGIHLPLYQL